MTLKTFIKNDLRSRLRSGRKLPTELKLQPLAGHYDVSFTPVRAALSELVAEGVLTRATNRRLTVAICNGSTVSMNDDERVEPPSRRGLLEVINDDLVRLSLLGEAVYLREEAAARKYRVSRSAIRNLFHRLSGEGLLLHIPRRGWQLRPFRQEDMQSFLEVRELLELKALELAGPKLEEPVLRELLDRSVISADYEETGRVDNSLHAYIIDVSANPYIKDFFDRHGRYYDILFDWEDQDREAAIETVKQHRQILDAILRQDWQTARSALSWHIRCNHPTLSKITPREPDGDSGVQRSGVHRERRST